MSDITITYWDSLHVKIKMKRILNKNRRKVHGSESVLAQYSRS